MVFLPGHFILLSHEKADIFAADFPSCRVLVVGGRQPALLLGLAGQKIPSQILSPFSWANSIYAGFYLQSGLKFCAGTTSLRFILRIGSSAAFRRFFSSGHFSIIFGLSNGFISQHLF